jgi:hypothetical protein
MLTFVALDQGLASYGGYLHMVHLEPSLGDFLMWTYFDGSTWSSEVSLPNKLSHEEPVGLAPHAAGLMLAYTLPHNWSAPNDVAYARFQPPKPPPTWAPMPSATVW